jgi:hypothetical protein
LIFFLSIGAEIIIGRQPGQVPAVAGDEVKISETLRAFVLIVGK